MCNPCVWRNGIKIFSTVCTCEPIYPQFPNLIGELVWDRLFQEYEDAYEYRYEGDGHNHASIWCWGPCTCTLCERGEYCIVQNKNSHSSVSEWLPYALYEVAMI